MGKISICWDFRDDLDRGPITEADYLGQSTAAPAIVRARGADTIQISLAPIRMSIIAENSKSDFKIIPAGNYLARCYGMIELGTIKEDGGVYAGKEQKKVRISWETPHECEDFGEGLAPYVIHQEYLLSMHEKANLRHVLESWRGAPFTEADVARFDVTRVLGKPCMINVIHKTSAANGNTRAKIASVTPLPKGLECPAQVNPRLELSYDNWNSALFETLPDYVKNRMRTSREFIAMSAAPIVDAPPAAVVSDALPF